MQNCNPTFNTSLTLLPSGLWRFDANPTSTTNGAEHYWGLIPNPNPATCTSIPFLNIINGQTYGSKVTSGGIVTPIGMGTGITGSTSGYGFQYSGIGTAGGCFKITHYVKCCGVWLRQTYCFCIPAQGLKSSKPEIIKSEVEKVDDKDVPKAVQEQKN